MKYNILIVDDHMVVREGLKLILETNDVYNVVGEAENGEEALELIEKSPIDVILMDLNMPVMNGLDTIKRLKEKNISTPIIILTTYNEDELMLKGLELGAKGYLLKDTRREELFRTLESAVKGEILLQPELMARLVRTKEKQSEEMIAIDRVNLTDKELFILKAAAKGFKNKEIADDLGIAERTVKAHFTNIFNKLNVNNRVEAVTVAIQMKLIHL
ncbi:response regulator [Priestia endophytica]|uniref:response regulator n=1 Tax=Priestia endophytica TaxID=135735 RepID=UPI00227E131D|nr:response regulator transcription factor [Priestia endophytica]MCY8235329.1 response regulator transcription factor [Priestia endophytica]